MIAPTREEKQRMYINRLHVLGAPLWKIRQEMDALDDMLLRKQEKSDKRGWLRN